MGWMKGDSGRRSEVLVMEEKKEREVSEFKGMFFWNVSGREPFWWTGNEDSWILQGIEKTKYALLLRTSSIRRSFCVGNQENHDVARRPTSHRW